VLLAMKRRLARIGRSGLSAHYKYCPGHYYYY